MVDYYSILEISSSATEEEIRRAYRKKAKELHPDVNTSPDAHHQFLLVQKAYQILTDVFSKQQYDRQRRAQDPLQSYQEWAREQRLRQERAARQQYIDQLAKREHIRKSKMYYPYIAGIYIISLVVLSFCLAILLGCAFLILKYSFFMFFFLLPFICVAAYVLKFTFVKFKEERAYMAAIS
jgi:hypothetical protein